jgi:hypothetical protein
MREVTRIDPKTGLRETRFYGQYENRDTAGIDASKLWPGFSFSLMCCHGRAGATCSKIPELLIFRTRPQPFERCTLMPVA